MYDNNNKESNKNVDYIYTRPRSSLEGWHCQKKERKINKTNNNCIIEFKI